MKIKYVQLESDAFLTDIDFVQFTPAERGMYCSLIFSLTSNDGKCTFDPRALSRICNCDSVEEFEKIWQRISKKFQLRNGTIRHKRVTRELCRTKKLLQAKRRGGFSTARKRWHSGRTANSTANAKETKGNVNVKVSKDLTNTADRSISSSDSLRSEQLKSLHFSEVLSRLIPPDRGRTARAFAMSPTGCSKAAPTGGSPARFSIACWTAPNRPGRAKSPPPSLWRYSKKSWDTRGRLKVKSKKLKALLFFVMSSPFGFAQGKLRRDIFPEMKGFLWLQPDSSASSRRVSGLRSE